MSSRTEATSSGGVFLSMLAVLFIGLKLTGHIDWSWWWVLAPIWGPFVVLLIILAIALPVIALSNARDWRR